VQSNLLNGIDNDKIEKYGLKHKNMEVNDPKAKLWEMTAQWRGFNAISNQFSDIFSSSNS
jgi:hypothetical protein